MSGTMAILPHYSASGQVLSLLTIPGEARLYVPQLPRPQQGLDPAAVALPQSAHYLRLCLRAQLASFCRPHVQQGKLVLALDDTSLPAMLCVVLLSSLHDVTVNTALRPPAWTRLLQNLGVPTVLDEANASSLDLSSTRACRVRAAHRTRHQQPSCDNSR